MISREAPPGRGITGFTAPDRPGSNPEPSQARKLVLIGIVSHSLSSRVNTSCTF